MKSILVDNPQRDITNNVRNNDREIARLTNERDKKLKMIKAAALKGDHSTGKMLAKDLQRLNTQIAAMGKVSGTLNNVKGKITQVNALDQMGNSLECGAKAMALANQNIDSNKLRAQAQNFQKQEMKMNMHDDIIQDALGGLEDNDYELSEEADKIYREACGYNEVQSKPQYIQPQVNNNVVEQPKAKVGPARIAIGADGSFHNKPQPQSQQKQQEYQQKPVDYSNTGDGELDRMLAELMK